MLKYKAVIIVLAALLLVSITLNYMGYNKSKKLEYALYETVISQDMSKYKVGSIYRSLSAEVTEKRLYIGEKGKVYNYYQRDFKELLYFYDELVSLYKSIVSYGHLSSYWEYSIFDMFEDFAVYFEYLYDQPYTVVESSEGQYLLLSGEALEGLQIIVDLLGDLDAIKNAAYEHDPVDAKSIWVSLMLNNEEYMKSPEVKEKQVRLKRIIKPWLPKTTTGYE